MPRRVLDLFAGIGGFSLGLERAGFETVAFCEREPFCQKVLAKRWPGVPIYDDVRELTAERLAGDGVTGISVITGGFPCQDISTAGRQAGIEGERSGLWSELARLVGELRPRYAILENVTNLLAGSTTERIPYDRCVCGWPYRWGGLHIPATQQEGEHLHAKGGRWHDEKSDADFSFFGGDWWEGQADEEGHSEMGGGALLDVDWRTGASFPGLDIPALDIEAEAGGILHCSGAPLGGAAKTQKRDEGLEPRREGHCGTHQEGDSASQPEGAGNSRGGQACECCGREVVYESSRFDQQTWFGRVLGDLAEIGYDAEWHCIPASHVGAHHRRDRVWIVAYPNGNGEPRGTEYAGAVRKAALLADADSPRLQKRQIITRVERATAGTEQGEAASFCGGWPAEPNVGRMADGVPGRVDRLKALGNAVVPQVVEVLGKAIMEAERGD